jgi:Transposase DDE domain
MLKRIVQPSTALVEFMLVLQLQLSQPQERHMMRLIEAVIVGEGRKTLAELYRLWVDSPDVSAASDFLRSSPWNEQNVGRRVQGFIMDDLINQATAQRQELVLWVSLDDSTHLKDQGTHALEGVDWVHDHTERTNTKRTKGLVEVSLHVQMGTLGYRFAFRLYLRERTVRRLNRQRADGDDPIPFNSKYTLARAMLEELRAILPSNVKVYVLMDRWYTSAKLIKYCRRQNWPVIGALKANRHLNGQRLDVLDRSLRHTRYTMVSVAGHRYWVRRLEGKLSHVPFEVCVLVSRRHPGATSPAYYLCTDMTLEAQALLTGYTRRWSIEVDYFDLKQYLGASDWRVHSLRAITRWWLVVQLALVFLQWQSHATPHAPPLSIPALIRQMRAAHAQEVLVAACQQVLRTGSLQSVVERFLVA